MNNAHHIFSALYPLLDYVDSAPVECEARELVLSKLAAATFSLSTMGLDKQELEYARYMLCAYIDEKFVVKFPGWGQEKLQQTFFGESDAGEGVFEHLDDMLETPERWLSVLFIYHICFEGGYLGRYTVGDQASLHLLRKEIVEVLLPYLQQVPKHHIWLAKLSQKLARYSTSVMLTLIGLMAAVFTLYRVRAWVLIEKTLTYIHSLSVGGL